MERKIKPGMRLWLKEGKPYDVLVRIKDKHGNTVKSFNSQVNNPKKEVRVIDIEFYENSKEETIIYYEVGVPGKPVNSAHISQFEWHPNNRICWCCKKPLSQTTDNICTRCGGVHCEVDGHCLCDHPTWGRQYR